MTARFPETSDRSVESELGSARDSAHAVSVKLGGARPSLRYLSVCSGIEAATVAWAPLGWEAAAYSEIEAFPRAVLRHHYPDTPLHGDFTTIEGDEYGPIDILVGGTPCQSFSVAGLRGGLDDDRGNLALEYLRLADRARPRWLVWENVPGVLSSNGGRDFGSILGGMGELGYGFAYRVLDAQFFGLAQRRRRVFVVGHLGDWRCAAAVLSERQSLCGDTAPRREAGQRVARPIAACAPGGSGYRNDADTADNLIAGTVRSHTRPGSNEVGSIVAFDARQSDVIQYGDMTGPLDTDGHTMAIAFGSKDSGADAEYDLSPTLRAGVHSASHANAGVPSAVLTLAIRGREGVPSLKVSDDGLANAILTPNGGRAGIGVGAIAIPLLEIGKGSSSRGDGPNGAGFGENGDPMFTLQAGAQHGVGGSAVRRLTPTECERLQGFPLVWQSLRIDLCFDHLNGSATAEMSCRRWLGNAWPADAGVCQASVEPADNYSNASLERLGQLVVALAPSSYEAEEAAVLSPERWRSLVSGVDESGWYRPLTPHGATAPGLAPELRALANTITVGRAALPQNIRLSIPAESGASSVRKSGRGKAVTVRGAANARLTDTFTTSDLGCLIPLDASTLATSLCSALATIAGCIPPTTLSANFSLSLVWADAYTDVPYRGKPAADGPRYRALGNSMAVPCMAWIGRRIAMVERLGPLNAGENSREEPS